MPEILAIFNEVILNSTALYDYKIRTMESMHVWYAEKQKGNYPIIGAFDTNDILLGFASYGMFRSRPAYKYTVEHSVYVRSDKRSMGIGKVLLHAIVKKAEEQNYHVMVAGIDASNDVSIQLHKKENRTYNGMRGRKTRLGRKRDSFLFTRFSLFQNTVHEQIAGSFMNA